MEISFHGSFLNDYSFFLFPSHIAFFHLRLGMKGDLCIYFSLFPYLLIQSKELLMALPKTNKQLL